MPVKASHSGRDGSHPLYKQTVILWSSIDPTEMELDEIVEREARGEFRVARRSTVRVDHPSLDKDFGVA